MCIKQRRLTIFIVPLYLNWARVRLCLCNSQKSLKTSINQCCPREERLREGSMSANIFYLLLRNYRLLFWVPFRSFPRMVMFWTRSIFTSFTFVIQYCVYFVLHSILGGRSFIYGMWNGYGNFNLSILSGNHVSLMKLWIFHFIENFPQTKSTLLKLYENVLPILRNTHEIHTRSHKHFLIMFDNITIICYSTCKFAHTFENYFFFFFFFSPSPWIRMWQNIKGNGKGQSKRTLTNAPNRKYFHLFETR